MGHKENGGIGITGLKMGLAVSPCHIIFSLDIFCKSFVPLPSFSSLCRICYNSLEKNAASTVAKKKIANFREMVREYFV